MGKNLNQDLFQRHQAFCPIKIFNIIFAINDDSSDDSLDEEEIRVLYIWKMPNWLESTFHLILNESLNACPNKAGVSVNCWI